MDAREQLRRYLEQRREMGETELLLDRMTVDEAMRLLGAPGTAATTGSTSKSGAADPNDWRAILRAADAAVEIKKPGGPVDRSADGPVDRSAGGPADRW